MAWQPILYALIGGGAAVISAVVAFQTWRHRDQREAAPFIALVIALGSWSLVYAVQLGFTTASEQLVWRQTGLAIGGTVPTLWLLFALSHTGYGEWLTRQRRVILAVEPLLFASLMFTNPAHEFIWSGSTFTPTQTGPIIALSLDVGYYLHIAYAYLAVGAGLVLLGLMFVRASPAYRRQTGALILGSGPSASRQYGLHAPCLVGPASSGRPDPGCVRHHSSAVGTRAISPRFAGTYWSVKITDGSIRFTDRQPRGNVVTLEFPAVT